MGPEKAGAVRPQRCPQQPLCCERSDLLDRLLARTSWPVYPLSASQPGHLVPASPL